MTLLRDLIDIPERVHRDDFVLRLSEGVDRPEETLRSYVVTPQLAEAFDRALGLIRAALASRSSKAAYLHGSFGSGKSHFMAVLHLLLQQHPAARAAEGLEGVVTRHDGWLADKRFLLVPYHMIGQPSLEAAVLGGYAARVAALRPDAPAPGVYRAEGLFADARRLREQIGDETFFARLNAASSGGGTDGGWGDLAAPWDAGGFEAALAAPGPAEARGRLVGALVDAFFTSYRDVARGDGAAFVPLDDGLAVMARHARGLGYDGLVLFLDELILWLATHAADLAFLNAEGPKVSKLVEAEAAGRPIPIVSFVARQRDLRELVGRQVTGAEQARRLYRSKLLPLIESQRGVTKAEAAARPAEDGAARAFRADDRLVNVRNVHGLAEALDTAAAGAGDCAALVERLAAITADLGIADADARRLRTARATAALARALAAARGPARVARLAETEPDTSFEAMPRASATRWRCGRRSTRPSGRCSPRWRG